MTRKNNNKTGIATLRVKLVVMALLLLVGVSYVVLRPQASGTKAAAASVVSTPPHRPDEVGQAKASQPGAPQPYLLEIKEWGVTVPLPDNLKDAYYTTAGGGVSEDGIPNTVWISRTSLNANGCDVTKNGPTEVVKPLGAYLRVLPTDIDPVKGITYKQLYPNGVMIDTHYYVYKPWHNATCVSKTELDSNNSAFTSASKDINKVTPTITKQ